MTIKSESRKVLLAGATGLVGQHILDNLITDEGVSEIHLFTRKPIAPTSPKVQVHPVDFSSLPTAPAVDEIYLSIG